MKLLREKFLSKDALYPTNYGEFMRRLTRVADVSKSLGTEEEKADRGKAFGSVYECFMYATIVGIKAEYPLPFERGDAAPKFYQIKFWKPEAYVDYIFMSLLALAEFPFSDIENLNEQEADARALELVKLMEFYAKGGLELMETKFKESPQYFETADNFVAFLKDIKPISEVV